MWVFTCILCVYLNLSSSHGVRLRSYNQSGDTFNKSWTRCCNTELVPNILGGDLLFDDFVQIQYKKLPYPMITEFQLREEASFYNKTIVTGKMWKISVDYDLEILNQNIFQGKRDVS